MSSWRIRALLPATTPLRSLYFRPPTGQCQLGQQLLLVVELQHLFELGRNSLSGSSSSPIHLGKRATESKQPLWLLARPSVRELPAGQPHGLVPLSRATAVQPRPCRFVDEHTQSRARGCGLMCTRTAGRHQVLRLAIPCQLATDAALHCWADHYSRTLVVAVAARRALPVPRTCLRCSL
jgi:hypothetical protein